MNRKETIDSLFLARDLGTNSHRTNACLDEITDLRRQLQDAEDAAEMNLADFRALDKTLAAEREMRRVVEERLRETLAALKEIEDARLAEEAYRWENIGSYPNVKIPEEVREKWLADLKLITDRQYRARKAAQELIRSLAVPE